jgi:hypothetical protein
MPLLTLELAVTRPRANGRAKMRMLFDEIAQKCDLPPLPAVASRALELARDTVETDRTWLAGVRRTLAEADARRQTRMAAL